MTSFLLSSPRTEPITLAEAAAFCGKPVDMADLVRAREAVEEATGRALISQKWQEVLDAWPDDLTVKMSKSPVIELYGRYFHAAYNTGRHDGEEVRQMRLNGHPFVPVHVDGERGIVTLPTLSRHATIRPAHGVEINYVAGFGPKPEDVPEELRKAVLHRVKYSVCDLGRVNLPEEYFEAIDHNRRAA